MDVLGFAALVVGGFTACAEFGSYAFVHPVIRRLPAAYHIEVEQGLLRTFGRVMPHPPSPQPDHRRPAP